MKKARDVWSFIIFAHPDAVLKNERPCNYTCVVVYCVRGARDSGDPGVDLSMTCLICYAKKATRCVKIGSCRGARICDSTFPVSQRSGLIDLARSSIFQLQRGSIRSESYMNT